MEHQNKISQMMLSYGSVFYTAVKINFDNVFRRSSREFFCYYYKIIYEMLYFRWKTRALEMPTHSKNTDLLSFMKASS